MTHRIITVGLAAMLMTACGGAAKQGDGTTASGGSAADGSFSDGERMVERGDFEGAAALFEKLVKKSPDDPKMHYYLALAKSKTGDVDGAIAHYEKAIAIDKTFMDAHINLGLLLMDKGELSRAEKELKIYLDASPGAADAHFNYGLVLEAMGKLADAKAHYEKAAALDPEDSAPLFGLGDLARKQGDKKAAVAFYEKARALDDQGAELVFVEGSTLIELKDTARACQLFKTLLEMTNPDLVIVAEAGKAIAGVDKACAKALYEGALEKDDTFATAHFYLANLLARNKQFKEAAKHFERFLEIAPDDPAAGDAKKRLDACNAQLK